jgi:uncharacterized protein YjdB
METVTSKGYNVIRANVGTNATWAATDTVNIAMQTSLARYASDGMYRVVENSVAYEHLPDHPDQVYGLEGVEFPEKDAMGEIIEYGNRTHSGGVQALWSDTPPPPPVPKYTLRLSLRGTMQVTLGETSPGFDMNRIDFSDSLSGKYDAPITLYNSHPNIVEAKITKVYGAGTAYNSFLSITPKKAGKATVRISADGYFPVDAEGRKHPEAADSITVIVTASDLTEYTQGVFFVNEDWFQHSNSSVNFLRDIDGWHYRAYSAVNNNEAFGATTQFGAIYGDNFFFVSKQEKDTGDVARQPGGRLVVANARTLAKVTGLDDIGGGDGRAFLGVDDTMAYISTSTNIVRFDLRTFTVGEPIGAQTGSGLYTGQHASMLRTGDRVFAVKQGAGILVINALTHTVDTVLGERHYFSLTLDNDGNLWSFFSEQATGVMGEEGIPASIVKIDPWTLETTELALPSGIHGPASSWSAWQLAPVQASKQDGKLYWVTPGKTEWNSYVSGHGAWSGRQIIAFDTQTHAAEVIFDLADYDGKQWHAYGGGFGVHPLTNDLYLSIQRGAISTNVWNTLRIDPATKTIAEEYPLDNYWWYVAMPVFPDLAPPVATIPPVTLDAAHRRDTIALRPLVTDADSPNAAIIKSIDAFDATLAGAVIRHDTLFITPQQNPTADTVTTVTLRFNSNGKTVTHDLAVTLRPGAIEQPVTGVAIDPPASTEVTVGQTLQLTATVTPANADNHAVTWESEQPLIATVDPATGLVTAHLAPATVRIIATTVDGGFTDGITLTTQAAPSSGGIEENPFELTQQAVSLIPGQQAQLALTAPQHFTNVAWRTTTATVASVTNAGLVTALAVGTTQIIASDATAGKADTCLVTILSSTPQYTLALNTSTLTLTQGERSVLTAVVTPQPAGLTLQWSSSNAAVADVTSTGTVIGLTPGTARITATLGAVTAVCSVTVSAPVSQPTVDGITQNDAHLAFPRVDNATYYLVHIYELRSGEVKPFLSLKVTPDGQVTLRATAGGNLTVPLQYLRPGTSYLVQVETVRETGGKAEVIRTEVTAFTTRGIADGILTPDAPAPHVRYADGALTLEGLAGYDCTLVSLSGQTLQRFHVDGPSEQRLLNLPAGLYILNAANASRRSVFKIIIR